MLTTGWLHDYLKNPLLLMKNSVIAAHVPAFPNRVIAFPDHFRGVLAVVRGIFPRGVRCPFVSGDSSVSPYRASLSGLGASDGAHCADLGNAGATALCERHGQTVGLPGISRQNVYDAIEDPQPFPNLIPAKRPQMRIKLFRQGELGRMIIDALWRAEKPWGLAR
jgi:hypothetical protein